MWKNQSKSMIVLLFLGLILILSILLHYSMNQAKAKVVNIVPTQRINLSTETINLMEDTLVAQIEPETTAEPPQPLNPTDLLTIRNELSRKSQETFMQPGWLHIQIFVYDMVNPDESVVVPETGQVIANSYMLDNWYFITEEKKMAAMYSKKQMLDGTFISLNLLSDGSIYPSSHPELIETATMDWSMSMQTIDRIISFGDEANLTINFENRYGIDLVTITTIDIFHEPIEDEDFSSPIVSYTGTLYYDWNTGQLLYDEGWVNLADGSNLLMNKRELKVLSEDQVSDEILQSFN